MKERRRDGIKDKRIKSGAAATMACFRGNREEFYGEVLLLDETKLSLSSDSGLKRSTGAGLLLHQVCSHLNLTQSQFFGLRFCNDRQQTFWLDPDRTLSQHQELAGPPYIFYFGVRFYSEEPHKLEESTRLQFYLQLQQDVVKGNMPLPQNIKPRLQALRLQAERGDYDKAERAESEENQEVTTIYRALSGVSQTQAQTLFLSLCSSLPMYGVTLFHVYGENQTEYFLGPTPVGVVIYKNRALVGKYFWQRISKVHFKKQTFELRVINRNGSETSFLFHCASRSDCKRLWSCCVQHHCFYRMQSGAVSQRIKPGSSLRALVLPRFSSTNQRAALGHACSEPANQSAPFSSGPTHHNITDSDLVLVQTAPPAVSRSVSEASSSGGGATVSTGGGATPSLRAGAKLSSGGGATPQSSAPWENSSHSGGLFNPRFPLSSSEPQRPHRRSRSLDGERPIGAQRRRARSHGNSSSESEKSPVERRQRRKHRSGYHGDQTPDSAHRRCRNRSLSPDAAVWRHIQRELVEPEAALERQTEQIPFTQVRVSQQPMRSRRSARGRRQRQWASASELQAGAELVPPLPVTTAADTSCGQHTEP